MRRSAAPLLLLAALALSACGGTEVVQPAMNVTIGQQLIDLKQAYDSGAIDEDEYKHQRDELIDSVDH